MSDEIKELESEDKGSAPEEAGKPAEESPEIDESELYGLFESILFLLNDPLPVPFFVKNFNVDENSAKIILDSIADEYEERDGGIKLIQIAGGYQFVTNKKYAKEIRRAMLLKKREGLTRGMLETLAIIAYKQPVILAEIDQLRGVSSRAMLAKLMRMNLIKPVGRKEIPGRPLLYGTTDDFLKHFGLNNLSDLPSLSEIDEYSTLENELHPGES
jgi:segregation and condensation protein B